MDHIQNDDDVAGDAVETDDDGSCALDFTAASSQSSFAFRA